MKYIKPPKNADMGAPLSQEELAQIIDDCINQPPWRANADHEADYADGNQLSSELLRRQAELGIPPAKENIISPAIAAVCGYEAKTRTDWRITPDGDVDGQDVADALNYRINQAERHSKADRAMSEAFRPQVTVGLGWVEVSRPTDPFAYPYRCRYVHRNEIWWDMRASEPDLSDAGWLVRQRFIKTDRAAAMFPKHAELIKDAKNISAVGYFDPGLLEGGISTGLMSGNYSNRAWTTKEHAWYNAALDEVCILEVWYRRWVPTMVLKLKSGRVVEFDKANQNHQAAVATGTGSLQKTTVARVRRSYWMGPVPLDDQPSPHQHQYFQYVPFWGFKEDMTQIPYALVRDMIFPQDNLNSTIAKLRWGMSSTRTERTKGAVAMTDAQFRRQVARLDADIVLDADAMAKPGSRFEVKRDFNLNAQQFQLMEDSRRALERVSNITASMQGRQGTARSGLQEQTQLEQSEMGLADIMDNFKEARSLVGEMLLAMILEDIGNEQETVVIEGDVLNEARTVVLNKPEVDEATGIPYLSNDTQRTRLKVALEDVPSSSSFRSQQLTVLGEAIKALPQEAQVTMMPFMVDLMDLPRKKQVVEALRGSSQAQTPEQIQAQIDQAVKDALEKSGLAIKEREVAIKERKADSEMREIDARSVQIGVQAAYSAMQAGQVIASVPQVAPVADAVMQGAGYKRPNPMGDDPNFPTAQVPAGRPLPEAMPGVQQNTSPAYPPVPSDGPSPMRGIETPELTDNVL